MAKVETITRSAFLAEGPHWDATNQCLYFVDIYGRSINKYFPATKEHTKAVIESKNPSVIGTDSVSLIIPVEGQKDKFLISIGKDLVVVTWDGKSPKVSNIERLVTVEGGGAINDGKCDATGRLWAGTLGGVWSDEGKLEGKNGILFTLNNKQINTHLTGISISNGLTWSLDNKTFYYIDSSTGCLEQYDCDISNGTITNGKTILTLSKHGIPGHFDGMTIDLDGNLWIAIFNGSRVIKVNPREQDSILQTVNIPALQVTSVAFGGPNLDELYVTSAALPVDGKPLTGSNDGATFKVTGLGVQGCAAVNFKL